jgi:outer membrane immunogenic protein
VDVAYNPAAAFFNAVPGSRAFNPKGFFGGGMQAGYNFQQGGFVYGVETDFGYGRIDASGTVPSGSFFTNGYSAYGQKMETFGTTRARFGTVLNSSLMAYATAGLAYGRSTFTAYTDAAPGLIGLQYAGSESKFAVGWTIGGGVEHRLGSGWTLKGEYLYYDLGTQTVTGRQILNPASTNTVTTRFDNAGNIVRAGINRQF